MVNDRWVEANGYRLHFLEHGEDGSPPLVILPGITSPAITWAFVARRLAPEHHVLTMDLRGRGQSDVGEDFSSAALAADVVASLPLLGLERPAILGHSAGARVAVTLAAMRPDARGPLIVADPPLSGPGREPYPTPLEPFLESIALARGGATADDMRPFFPTWTDEQLALRAEWLGTCDPDAVAAVHRSFHEEDFFDHWPKVAAPVLFVWAGAAPVVGAAGAADAAAANPSAEVVELSGVGHMLPWDDLEGFLGIVRDFLRGVT
jgi:N-formylmaleamate deformylase